jgi:alkanesulfonate monooxygenase SsuD/methylene tetrahydromethanopterin reductase-like flavin-dependent oxidoreductase (luciferase family)
VLCAEDGAEACWLHASSRLSLLRLRSGRPATLPSPEEAARRDYSAAELAVIEEATASHVVGDPAGVIDALERLVASTGADELMVTTSTFAHADRLASYELLARAAADRISTGGPHEQAVISPACGRSPDSS